PKEEPAAAEPVKPLPEAAPKKAVAAAQKAEVKAETNAQEKHGQPDAKNKKGLESIIQLVGFNLGREYYGVDINRIREIIRTTEITKVPRAPEFIEGVINLRGSVIPVINLRTRVKMPRREYDKNTRIMIVELKDKTIGFIVDAVREVLRIPESILAPPPVLAVGRGADYITAVAKLEDELVILMDTDKVLSKEDTIKLEDNTRKK
ncbi:MAG: chemotaxis protein CheW, partial [Ignavibacteriales bacterium]